MKKFISCLLAVIMVMSFAVVAFASGNDFTDISEVDMKMQSMSFTIWVL